MIFITIYVKFNKGNQTSFLKTIKSKTNLTWKEIAKKLDITKSMIFFYLNETNKISYKNFIKLCKLSNLNPNNFKINKVEIKNKLKKVTIPNQNEGLAEFLGIHIGDGHLNTINYDISIVCGGIDKNYITKFIPNLIQQLFSIKAKIYYSKRNKAIKCRFYSKEIANFLINKYSICNGKKKNPKIPNQIFQNQALLRSCIRGLIDTDGGIHKHHKKSIQLKFDSKHYSLTYSIMKAFLQLGFNSRLSKNQKRNIYTVYLFGKEVEKYFEEIGSNNPKNNIKFKIWKEEGIVPLNTEISSLIQNN